MASTPTPSWVRIMIGVIALVVATAIVLHLTGIMPRLHHMS